MHCHYGTNKRAPRWTFTDPCKPEVPGRSQRPFTLVLVYPHQSSMGNYSNWYLNYLSNTLYLPAGIRKSSIFQNVKFDLIFKCKLVSEGFKYCFLSKLSVNIVLSSYRENDQYAKLSAFSIPIDKFFPLFLVNTYLKATSNSSSVHWCCRLSRNILADFSTDLP